MTTSEPIKYVIYYRVSTKRQGESGLGLEAQARDVKLFLTNYSERPFLVLESFTDVWSAKGHTLDERPVLKRAIELAERLGAVLLVAKLDRLGRSVELVSHLLNRKHLSVRVACMPQADKMQLQILSMLAEQEREFISARTKAALAVAKSRGVKLGGYREGAGRKQAVKARDIEESIEELIKRNLESVIPKQRTLQYIADDLNQRGYKTAKGKSFSRMQVSRTIKYLGIK